VGDDIMLEDLGTLSGTLVNGKRIAQYGPLNIQDEVLIGPCFLRAHRHVDRVSSDTSEFSSADQPASASAAQRGIEREQHLDVDTAYGVRHEFARKGSTRNEIPKNELHQTSIDHLLHRQRLHAALREALDLRRRDVAQMSDALLRSEAARLLLDLVKADAQLPSHLQKERLMREVLDEAVGLGPLSPLLEDKTITEIMVNRYDEIYVERDGRLMRHDTHFSSEQAVLGVLERIVAPVGRRIDESSPMVDARLSDGSRVNAVVSPVSLKGASLTIRKFPQQALTMEDLIRLACLDEAMAVFLARCVRERVNIIISGGTGSGKTTLLNVLSNAIPQNERIITIEDAAELRLNHVHIVALEARPANLEGRGRIDIRALVRNALRMRPDRIVVGECRGAEALDMLAAMNTGHEGSLTTLHANSPRDALARLETMILMAGIELPLVAVREQIASSIHLIVQPARLSNGQRVVTRIVEVTGMESGRIQTHDLFRYERAQGGYFQGCGALPTFAERWRDEGRPCEAALFTQRTRCRVAQDVDGPPAREDHNSRIRPPR
jgi:pilus assembly protein CpaF